jgi:hypothetical protein
MTASRQGDQGKASLILSLASVLQGPASDHQASGAIVRTDYLAS